MLPVGDAGVHGGDRGVAPSRKQWCFEGVLGEQGKVLWFLLVGC